MVTDCGMCTNRSLNRDILARTIITSTVTIDAPHSHSRVSCRSWVIPGPNSNLTLQDLMLDGLATNQTEVSWSKSIIVVTRPLVGRPCDVQEPIVIKPCDQSDQSLLVLIRR